jgi:hypothetical protein
MNSSWVIYNGEILVCVIESGEIQFFVMLFRFLLCVKRLLFYGPLWEYGVRGFLHAKRDSLMYGFAFWNMRCELTIVFCESIPQKLDIYARIVASSPSCTLQLP